MTPTIMPYFDKKPQIAEDAFIAPGACIIGDVEIGSKAGIWFNCVIRGDVCPVKIGDRTNIQDGTIVHVTRNTGPTFIGSRVTIGHKALIHACTIHDDAFIGMGAIIMDGAIIESGAMVAAGSLVSPGKIVKKGELWAGVPAKLFRYLKEEEQAYIPISEQNYTKHAEEYLNIMRQLVKVKG